MPTGYTKTNKPSNPLAAYDSYQAAFWSSHELWKYSKSTERLQCQNTPICSDREMLRAGQSSRLDKGAFFSLFFFFFFNDWNHLAQLLGFFFAFDSVVSSESSSVYGAITSKSSIRPKVLWWWHFWLLQTSPFEMRGQRSQPAVRFLKVNSSHSFSLLGFFSCSLYIIYNHCHALSIPFPAQYNYFRHWFFF